MDQRTPNNINAATGMTGIHAILGELMPPVLKTTKLSKEAENTTKTWAEKLTASKKKTIKKIPEKMKKA